MFMNRFFRKFLHPRVEDIDRVKLIYILSLVIGLLSVLAAAFLRNAVQRTNLLFTNGITAESGSYLYLVYPVIGMIILVFVIYLVMDNNRTFILPVPYKGYYAGFISKSKIYSTYRELLIRFSEE
jgi:hypothetical protein